MAEAAPPLHREGFSRPETTLEKIGYAGSAWLGRIGIAIVLLLVFFALLVGIPAWSVAGSPAYGTAKAFIATDDQVSMEVGGEVIGFDRVPVKYRVGPDKGEYVFYVQGAMARGLANVTVTREGGVWHVTSASFVTDTRQRGVHRRVVLKDGSAR